MLGNTPAVCRKCYIHPRVVEVFMDGAGKGAASGLLADPGLACSRRAAIESAVVRLLAGKSRRRPAVRGDGADGEARAASGGHARTGRRTPSGQATTARHMPGDRGIVRRASDRHAVGARKVRGALRPLA
jgi:DNA topoisomerase-1